MDKKTLVKLTEGMVTEIATTNNCEEGEARCLLVLALRANREAILASVAAPKLTVGTPAPAETEEAA